MKAYFIALVASLTSITSTTSATSIIFTGDILLDRGVRKVIEHHGTSYLFDKQVDSILHTANVVVGNLECPATSIKAPMQKRFIFRGELSWLSVLKQHRFTHLNLANNHSVDQGRNGLMDTRDNIIKAGMMPIGAGKNIADAAKAVLLTEQPRKVWLIASLRMALENYAYLP
jgi:poly-gamma-glutamate synthesis protein (capsule biosynthesis protein)